MLFSPGSGFLYINKHVCKQICPVWLQGRKDWIHAPVVFMTFLSALSFLISSHLEYKPLIISAPKGWFSLAPESESKAESQERL